MNTKFYFISALASMALLSGCSDNELASVETSQKTPIGFHTVGSQMGSRATIINQGNITQTDFRVFAFTQKSAEDTSDDIQFMGDKTNDYGHTPESLLTIRKAIGTMLKQKIFVTGQNQPS